MFLRKLCLTHENEITLRILLSLLTKVVKKRLSEKYSHILYSTFISYYFKYLCVFLVKIVTNKCYLKSEKCVQEEIVRVYTNRYSAARRLLDYFS